MSGPARRTAIGLVLAGAAGVLASATLIIERFHLLEEPGRILTCDLNPVVSCGSVMSTGQAQAFGFPNPLIGVVGFTVVITVGVVLACGLEPPRWFLRSFGAGTVFGIGFVHWLGFQSLYRIGALCPYCIVVWAAMAVIFVLTAGHLAQAGALPLPARIGNLLVAFRGAILVAWTLLVLGLITRRFWSYWETVLP